MKKRGGRAAKPSDEKSSRRSTETAVEAVAQLGAYRSDRIRRIKDRVRDGSYRIDARDVAEAILEQGARALSGDDEAEPSA